MPIQKIAILGAGNGGCAAAAKYFPALTSILKDPMGFTNRNRQPPRDPVNSMLSFGYTLLFYNIFALAKSHGLHPYVGFFHEMRSGHPALVSDLIEEFRAPIVESLVLYLVNSKVLKQQDFALPKEPGLPCLLSDDARKLFIHHFEQKMNSPMTRRFSSLPAHKPCFAAYSPKIRQSVFPQKLPEFRSCYPLSKSEPAHCEHTTVPDQQIIEEERLW